MVSKQVPCPKGKGLWQMECCPPESQLEFEKWGLGQACSR